MYLVEFAILDKVQFWLRISGLLWDKYCKIALQNFPNRDDRDHWRSGRSHLINDTKTTNKDKKKYRDVITVFGNVSINKSRKRKGSIYVRNREAQISSFGRKYSPRYRGETPRNCSVRKIPEEIEAIKIGISSRNGDFIGREILPEHVKNFLSLGLWYVF